MTDDSDTTPPPSLTCAVCGKPADLFAARLVKGQQLELCWTCAEAIEAVE